MTITESTALTMRRGDTFTFDVTVTLAGAALDLTTYGITSTGKTNLSDTDAQAIYQVTKTGGGITVTGAGNNVARVVIPAAATSGMTTNATIWYDCQIKLGANVYTVALGRLSIYLDVTVAA